MPVVFYYFPSCGPCRAILMTAEHLGIELDKKRVDLMKGEQLKPELLKINPQHCVPTIDDDGFYLWESRAILTYLVNKYAPNSPLYPQNPEERALIDKMLYFEIGNLSKTLLDYMLPLQKGQPGDPEKEKEMKKSLAIFENILQKTPYAAGNHLTLADYSLLTNLVAAEEVVGYNYAEYPKISAWLETMKKETPKYEEINKIPLREFKDFLKSKN